MPYSFSDTPYYRLLIDTIMAWKQSGVGHFLPSQLAEAVSRKVTPSMRKALVKAWGAGLITRYTYETLKGGVGVGYLINNTPEEQETVEYPF